MARQEARGNSKEPLSDFTFLHIPLIFSVHLLITAFYITGYSDRPPHIPKTAIAPTSPNSNTFGAVR
ncbi:MAG: hypothetical protein ACKO3K_09070 [Cuspidothrix sp.]